MTAEEYLAQKWLKPTARFGNQIKYIEQDKDHWIWNEGDDLFRTSALRLGQYPIASWDGQEWHYLDMNLYIERFHRGNWYSVRGTIYGIQYDPLVFHGWLPRPEWLLDYECTFINKMGYLSSGIIKRIEYDLKAGHYSYAIAIKNKGHWERTSEILSQ